MNDEYPLLAWAVDFRKNNFISFLLSRGANAQYQSKEGLTLLDDTIFKFLFIYMIIRF